MTKKICKTCKEWHSFAERRELLWQMSMEESDIFMPLAEGYLDMGINLNKPYDRHGSGFCMNEGHPEKITLDIDGCKWYLKRSN